MGGPVATKSESDKTRKQAEGHSREPYRGLQLPGHQAEILALQRTAGNRAVQGLFESGLFQAKLGISRAGDRFEQEADRVADQVMRKPTVVQAKPG